jgi:hypothetical protein
MLVSAMLFSFIILGLAALLVLQSPSLAVDVPEWAAATVVIAGAVILILLPTMLSVIDCLAQVSAQRSFFGHLQQAGISSDPQKPTALFFNLPPSPSRLHYLRHTGTRLVVRYPLGVALRLVCVVM